MIDDALLEMVDGKWCLNEVPFDGVTEYKRYGTIFWYMKGEFHREDGPAIEEADGITEWWIHGKRIHTWKEYHALSSLSPQEQMIVKLKYGEQLK